MGARAGAASTEGENALGVPGRARVIWLNGTVGSGKSAVGRALAARLPGAVFLDGDDLAGPSGLPNRERWAMALAALLQVVAQRRRRLVIAYPLDRAGYARLRARCGGALLVVTLATPLPIVLRGRGRMLDAWEMARVRAMRAAGYHRRRFAALTVPNAVPPASRTAALIARRLARPLRACGETRSGGHLTRFSCAPRLTASRPFRAEARKRAPYGSPGRVSKQALR